MDVLKDIKERLEFLKEMGVTELPASILSASGGAESVALTETPLSERVRLCEKCGLSSERINAIPGAGAGRGIMFVSMTPSEEEDKEGALFSGKGGELLLSIIKGAFKMTKDDVYVTNVVKCRGRAGRLSTDTEIKECFPYLEEEINAVRPKVIITLGDEAANALLNRSQGVARLRGKIYSYKGIKLTPIYHPAELLEKPELKGEAWKDLQMVISEIDSKAGAGEKGR